jgi:hypothetical protein
LATDTIFSVAADTVVECTQKMQENLDALSGWLKFDKLKLNVSKTKLMIITSKRSSASIINYTDGKKIEEVQSMNCFVVQIDN